ncbi:hypothetical protein [Pararobbsia silviterrae]|uniref:hypothetical protein n=1 Tax=Pararobbsia silviterrae TaxID=1792498 RepID=UPI0011C470A2|nr:hypothetical protein [Pararobbsia silviterrae]
MAVAPSGTHRPAYRVMVAFAAPGAYTIYAVPARGHFMEHDACGTFALDSNGRTMTTGPLGAQTCWHGP